MNEEMTLEVLISRYLNGDAESAELQQLRDRAAASPSIARAVFRQAMVEQELADFFASGSADLKVIEPEKKAPAFRISRWIPLAAAAALVGAAGIWWFSGQKPSGESSRVLAHVTQQQGVVYVQRGQNLWVPIKTGDELREGMRIRTDATAIARFKYDGDGSWVEMDPGTEVLCVRPGNLDLSNGRILADIARQPADKPFCMTTVHGRVVIVGTRLRLEAADAFSLLVMESGRALVEPASQSTAVFVQDGQFLKYSGNDVPQVKPNRELKYRDGRILFRDDFENGLANWKFMTFTYKPRDEGGYNRVAPQPDEPVKGTHYDIRETTRNEKQTRVMSLDPLSDGRGVAAFCQWSEMGKAYVVEYSWRADLCPPPVQDRLQNDIPVSGTGAFKLESGSPNDGMLEDLVAQRNNAERWDKRRIEIISYRDAEGLPWLLVRDFRGDKPCFVGRTAKGTNFIEQLRIGVAGMRLFIDDYTVKELVPEVSPSAAAMWTKPETKFLKSWTFDSRSQAENFPVVQGSWHWERGADGTGRMALDAGVQSAVFVLPCQTPQRPFLLDIKTSIPAGSRSVLGAAWVGSDAFLPHRKWYSTKKNLTLTEAENGYHAMLFFIGRHVFAAYPVDNEIVGIQEYDKEYPSDRILGQIYSNMFLTGIEMRELEENEVNRFRALLDAKLAELKAQGTVFKSQPGMKIQIPNTPVQETAELKK